jgi:hypothetical protein
MADDVHPLETQLQLPVLPIRFIAMKFAERLEVWTSLSFKFLSTQFSFERPNCHQI